MAANPHVAARRRRNLLLYVASAIILAVWAFPVLWAVVVSLKSETDVLAYPPRSSSSRRSQNYVDALFGGFSILRSFTTSFIISTATTVLTILFAVPAAYAFARLRCPASERSASTRWPRR